MRERILDHLKQAGEPLPSNKILMDLLQIRSPSDSAADKVLHGILGEDCRFVFANGLWYPRLDAASSRWETEAAVMCIQSARQQTHLRGAIRFPSGVLRSFATSLPGQPEIAQAAGEMEAQITDCPLVTWCEQDLRLWNILLRRCGHREWSGNHLPLRSVAARVLGRPEGSITIEGLASALSLAQPVDDQPWNVAVFLADCLPVLLNLVPPGPRAGIRELRSWISAGRKKADFSRFGFGPEFLDLIPQTPGAYVMKDASGTVIYVGKSRNLRRRIRSYFTPSGIESAKTARIHERLHSIQFRSVPNEVEALLLEMRLIRRLRPAINLQTDVHARRTKRREPNLLLIVASETAEKATIYFLRKGLFAGKQSFRLHRFPSLKLRQKIRTLYFSKTGPSRSRDPRQVEIVSRWISQNSRHLNWIDVDESGSLENVMGRVRDYLNDPDNLRNKVFYR